MTNDQIPMSTDGGRIRKISAVRPRIKGTERRYFYLRVPMIKRIQRDRSRRARDERAGRIPALRHLANAPTGGCLHWPLEFGHSLVIGTWSLVIETWASVLPFF